VGHSDPVTDLPGRIRSRAGLAAVSHQDFVDVRGGDAGLRNCRAPRDRTELGGMDVAKRSAVLSDRRSLRAEDDHVTTTSSGHKQLL
jgi:hypothetical protein